MQRLSTRLSSGQARNRIYVALLPGRQQHRSLRLPSSEPGQSAPLASPRQYPDRIGMGIFRRATSGLRPSCDSSPNMYWVALVVLHTAYVFTRRTFLGIQQSSGRTAFDVDIDGMEEQPWRHPGVDIADFFNYGFTEDSWRVYCEKQLRCVYEEGLWSFLFNALLSTTPKSAFDPFVEALLLVEIH